MGRRNGGGVAAYGSPSWSVNGFPSSGRLASVEIVEHFLRRDEFASLAVSVSGTGAAAASGAPSTGARIGITSLSTGTTTTGSAAFTSDSSAILLGGGRHRLRWDVNVPTASDGTETFACRLGFLDSTTGDATDGAYFRYTHGTNGGEWEAVTRSNGSETATDTNVTLSAGTFRAFEIEVNAAGTSVAFYINGALVAAHTSNIPSSASRNTGIIAGIIKSAGTTARTMEFDLMAYSFEPSTPL